jgi:glycosyltransferase involved in cell wall biosynthesis
VWTVHNLYPHDAFHPRLEAVFRGLFTRSLSAFIALSAAGVGAAEAAYPALRRKPRAIIQHGSYAADYAPWQGSETDARAHLGLAKYAEYLLFLGQIRRYKGVPKLVEVFKDRSARDLRLNIAGEVLDVDLLDELSQSVADDDSIGFFPERVPDEDIAAWYAGAIGTVLPFSAGLNSGSLLLSLSFGRPVLVPRTPVFDEIASLVGEDWVRRYDGGLTVEVLEAFISAARASNPADAGYPDLGLFSWDRMAAGTAEFYQSL